MATGRQVAYLCSPAAVDEGANWPIGAGATGVQVRAVPWLNQTNEVGTLALVCQHREKEREGCIFKGLLILVSSTGFITYTKDYNK